jgi:hypothetical protein
MKAATNDSERSEAVSKVIWDPKDNDHCYAFVDFRTKEEAESAAREVDGTSTSWGTIIVSKAKKDLSWKVYERERVKPERNAGADLHS